MERDFGNLKRAAEEREVVYVGSAQCRRERAEDVAHRDPATDRLVPVDVEAQLR